MSGEYWETEVFGVAPLAGLERVNMDDVFDWLGRSLPAIGSKVDWSSVRGQHSHLRFDDDDELSRRATREVMRRLQESSGVDHVGDSLSPFGIHFAGGDAEAIVAALLEIPEHHYFVDRDRTWLVVVSSEGDLDTVDLPGAGAEREA